MITSSLTPWTGAPGKPALDSSEMFIVLYIKGFLDTFLSR
jgi:hypothetical protein